MKKFYKLLDNLQKIMYNTSIENKKGPAKPVGYKNMKKFTTKERAMLRSMRISMNDVHKTGSNSMGTVYGLYNPYYLTEITVYGTSNKRYIYHKLVEHLFYNQMKMNKTLIAEV